MSAVSVDGNDEMKDSNVKKTKNVLEIVKSFVNAVFVSFVALAVLVIATIWILPLAFGLKPTTVLSDSMKPTFSAGDVIWVDTSKQDVKIGDVIVFHPEAYSNTLVTHRVIATNSGTSKTFTTQGDANNTPDESIVEGQIVGVAKSPLSAVGVESNMMAFPKVGYLQKYLVKIGIVVVSVSVLAWIASSVSAKRKGKVKKTDTVVVEDTKNKSTMSESSDNESTVSNNNGTVNDDSSSGSDD